MATRVKTIEYAFPMLASLPDNALTALTSIKVFIPEGSYGVTFKSVVAELSCKELATHSMGNYTSRRIDLAVNGAAAVSYTNANLYSTSGENTSLFYCANATSNFTTNWAGTSCTIACSVLIDNAATTIAMGDVEVRLYITYEYNDTAPTQIKTVYIPLMGPVGNVASAKPGTALDTIPALDTELPEASKTIRSMFILSQGNISNQSSTTDSTISIQIDTYTAYTSGVLEMTNQCDYWTRFLPILKYYDSAGAVQGIGMDTSASHGFYIWGSIARFPCPQTYLVVTYEFDATASNDCYNSVMLFNTVNELGDVVNSASNYNKFVSKLQISEPGTIVTKQIAMYGFFVMSAAPANRWFRIGTGSYVAYGGVSPANFAGGLGVMVKNNAAYTLARGLNNLETYFYGGPSGLSAFSSFMIVNYVSGKPSQGYGAANKTVRIGSSLMFGMSANSLHASSDLSINIPEANYQINSFAVEANTVQNSTSLIPGIAIGLEKTTSGTWAVKSMGWATDAETGLIKNYFDFSDLVYRWAGDLDPDRINPESIGMLSCNTFSPQVFFAGFVLMTYHSITFTVSGSVSGYSGDGSGITVDLINQTRNEKVGSAVTSAGGAFSITCYDNVDTYYTAARQDATHLGRSDNGTPT